MLFQTVKGSRGPISLQFEMHLNSAINQRGNQALKQGWDLEQGPSPCRARTRVCAGHQAVLALSLMPLHGLQRAHHLTALLPIPAADLQPAQVIPHIPRCRGQGRVLQLYFPALSQRTTLLMRLVWVFF